MKEPDINFIDIYEEETDQQYITNAFTYHLNHLQFWENVILENLVIEDELA